MLGPTGRKKKSPALCGLLSTLQATGPTLVIADVGQQLKNWKSLRLHKTLRERKGKCYDFHFVDLKK
jgi:hypothetical protein